MCAASCVVRAACSLLRSAACSTTATCTQFQLPTPHPAPPPRLLQRQTITNMLGTLPPQFFRVVISTEAENLAQLMYSVLMSGYM